MKGPFDEALVAQCIAMQGVRMSTTEIWKEIRPRCHIVLDVATADRIIEQKDRWGDRAQDVADITDSSKVGMRMFGWARELCAE